jgi:hypothetical protein
VFGALVEATGVDAPVLGAEFFGVVVELTGLETPLVTLGAETVGFGVVVEPTGADTCVLGGRTVATGVDTVVFGVGTGGVGVMCVEAPPAEVEALAIGVEMVVVDTVAGGFGVGALGGATTARGALALGVPFTKGFAIDVATCADGGALPATAETVAPAMLSGVGPDADDADSAAALPTSTTASTPAAIAKNTRAPAAAGPTRTSPLVKKDAMPRLTAGHRGQLPAFLPGVMRSPG